MSEYCERCRPTGYRRLKTAHPYQWWYVLCCAELGLAYSGLWHAILASFKVRFPTHHDRSFSPQTKTWSVPRSHYQRLARWADYWFDGDAQQWDDDEEPDGRAYGRRTDSETRSSDGRGGTPRAGSSALAAAYAQLHLLPSAPAELVQAAHRTLIKLHHPDHGGDHGRAVALNAAIALIRQSHKEAT
jgi:hypothetical protein